MTVPFVRIRSLTVPRPRMTFARTWATALSVFLLGALAAANHSPESGQASDWHAPIGIPEPPFGIHEQAPSVPSPWRNVTPGFYYVEASSEKASDDHNEYGWPNRPRRTIPLHLLAGTVVEVHGTYDFDHDSPRYVFVEGTADRPVWIRGADNQANRPKFTHSLLVYGSYAIVENILFDHSQTTAGGDGVGIGLPSSDQGGPADCSQQKRAACSNHIVFRHNELMGSTGPSSFRHCGGLSVGGWTTNLPRGSSQSFVVFWDNNIHDEGQMEPLPPSDQDQACSVIAISRYAHHIWVLDNSCTNVAQSCVQIAPTTDGSAYNDTHHIFVGRNNSNRATKNAFWCKAASDVVFSQNVAHDTIEKNYNPATGFGLQYGPQRVWFLFNEAYRVTDGIELAGDSKGGADQRYFLIGNVIHDISNNDMYFPKWDPEKPWSAAAIADYSGAEVHSVHNTIWGLDHANGINRAVSGGSHEVTGNVIGGFRNAKSYAIYFEDEAEFSRSQVDDNDLFPSHVKVSDSTYGKPNRLPNSKCRRCIAVDPGFQDMAAKKFRPIAASPVVGKGSANSVYDTFQQLYGLDIRKDFSGMTRPLNAPWDVGAFQSLSPTQP